MKHIKFFLRIVLIILLPFLLIYGIKRADLALNPNSENAYLTIIANKMSSLYSVSSPRLLLMSGSSMAFGVDSDLLSKELEIPVINASPRLNLGSKCMMNELKATVRKGDIVLITLEYVVSSKGMCDDNLGVSGFCFAAKEWSHFASFFKKIEAFAVHGLTNFKFLISDAWQSTPQKSINLNEPISAFFEKKIAKDGDLINHLNNPQAKFEVPELPVNVDFSEQIQDLNDFEEFAKQKGVTVFFTFPSYVESGYEKNMPIIKRIEQQLRTNLNFTILGSPENSVMDDEFFYDNVFHPNAQGRKIFSSRLIQLLEQEQI